MVTINKICQDVKFEGILKDGIDATPFSFVTDVCGYEGNEGYANESFKYMRDYALSHGPFRSEFYRSGRASDSTSFHHTRASIVGAPRTESFEAETRGDYIDYYCGGKVGLGMLWCQFTAPIPDTAEEGSDYCSQVP